MLPQAGATGVTSNTVFQWTPVEDAIYEIGFLCDDVSLVVYTAENHFKLPDISPVGQAFPRGLPCQWSPTALGPAESIDDFVGTTDRLKEKGRETFAFTQWKPSTLAN